MMKSLVYDKIRLGVAVLLCLCTSSWVDAKVKLPALISDGMVLQRERPVKVWGTADAGEYITVKLLRKSYHATADANGHWSIALPPLKAGGPYQMQINDIKLNNILIGDVWLCSGQSNMELPVKRVMDMFAQEILSYNNEKIRHIIIPKDDHNWQTVNMFSTSWGNNGLNPIGGSHWLRQNIEIPQAWTGKEATLRLGCIVDDDSVYVNGIFVGTTGYQYPPRIYRIPAGVLKSGENNITVRIISNGGQPNFVQEKPYKIICDNEEINLKQEWKYRLGAPMPPSPDMMFFCYKPVCLYNAMIAPLQNYSIRGVLWYQGESNVARRNEYTKLLTAMIADWRHTFNQPKLPFYIVELADFLSKDDIGGRKAWAEMRQEQAKAASANQDTYLIQNSDLGEWNDIHPLDKKTLGKRIAESALNSMKR